MIRVLVADDHELVRAGIRYLLEEASDIKIVAEAASGAEAVTEFKRARPDIVILDISMPGLAFASRSTALSIMHTLLEKVRPCLQISRPAR